MCANGSRRVGECVVCNDNNKNNNSTIYFLCYYRLYKCAYVCLFCPVQLDRIGNQMFNLFNLREQTQV